MSNKPPSNAREIPIHEAKPLIERPMSKRTLPNKDASDVVKAMQPGTRFVFHTLTRLIMEHLKCDYAQAIPLADNIVNSNLVERVPDAGITDGVPTYKRV